MNSNAAALIEADGDGKVPRRLSGQKCGRSECGVAETAVEGQRNWLKKGNKECVIYKGWVICLTGAYETRIAELKKTIEEQKKQAPSR
jgi:hypothetical protein